MTGFEPPSIPFDPPFDPGAIPPTITPAIGLLSPSITPASIPPYTPSGIEPRFGPWWPRSGSTAQREGMRKRPRHPLTRVENGEHRIINAAASPRLQRQRQSLVSTATLIFPCASRSFVRCERTPNNPLCRNETRCCHHLSADQKDIYARALSRPLALLEASAPARAPGQRRNVEAGEKRREGPDHLSKSRGGGGDSAARPIIDLLSRYSVALFQNLGGRVSKNLGRRVKSPALTQGSRRIRQIGLAATPWPPEPNPHQRPFVSHGVGMSS